MTPGPAFSVLGHDRDCSDEDGFWERLLHPGDRERILSLFRNPCDELTTVHAAYRLLSRDGESVQVDDYAFPDLHPVDGVPRLRGIICESLPTGQREDLYISMIDALHEGVVVQDADGAIITCNASAERILGLSMEQMAGRTSLDPRWRAIHEDGTPYPGETHPAMVALRTGQPVHNAIMGVHTPDGQLRWILINAQPLRHEGEAQPHAAVTSFVDISDLRRAEHELRLARYALEHAADAVYWIAEDGRILYANQSASASLGYSREQLARMNVTDIRPPIVPDEWRQRWERLKSAERATVETVHFTSDGREFPVEISGRYVNIEGAEFVCAFARDISERKAAQDALAASEARYRLLAERSNDVISRHAPDGTMLYISPAIETVVGRSPRELLGVTWMKQIHPDDRPLLEDMLRELRSGRPVATVTYRSRRNDSNYFWFETTAVAMRDPADGRLIEIHASARDITERRAAEDALRESEARYRLLAERSRDVISRHAPDGIIPYVSPAIETLAGFRPEELVGTRWLNQIHPEDQPPVVAALTELQTGGPAVTVTYRARRKDGSYFWLETTGIAVRDPEGRLTEIQGSSRDVTARHAAEEALRESDVRFRLLAENSTDVIARHAPDLTCLYISPSVEAALGYRPDELVGTDLRRLVHPDDRASIPERVTALVTAGGRGTALHRVRRRDGSYAWFETTTADMADPATGDVRELHTVSRDVTARKAMEDERQRLDALKSEFIAVVSHELRAPLTNINGGLELIEHDARYLPAAAQRTLEMLRAESMHLTFLVESILDVTRLDAGRLPINIGPIHVGAVVRRATESIADAATRERLTIAVPPRFPLARGDEMYLEQALRNLISNAAKYSPPGAPIEIAARTDGNDAVVRVTDHGPGIADSEKAHVFDAFYRAPRDARSAPGYGLGLYISRKLIEAQRGAIDVLSPVFADRAMPGAAFELRLPLFGDDDE